MEKLDAFISLANIFNDHGYSLYLVGGSVRDYLLFHNLNDLDVVTNATPDEVERFYQEKATYAFKKYGAVTLYHHDYRFDLTTLRKEKGYEDKRHPDNIIFVKDLKEDVIRRDFTINAIYMDKNLKTYDYVDGIKDLENKIIRMIGDADKRIKEDPLRILRAIRFSLTFNFDLDESLVKAINDNIDLLKCLRKEKIMEEIHKMKKDKMSLIPIFDKFNIHYLLDMVL